MVDAQLLAGVAAAAAAAACFDGAVILQAAETRAVPSEHGLRLSLLRRLAARPRWLLGTAVAILGWPLQLLALSLAPLTVVQPTLALGLVVLLLGGRHVLDERVGRREWAAVVLIAAGVLVLALAGPHHTATRPQTGPAVLTGLVLGLLVAAPFLLPGGRDRPWSLIFAAGSAFALSALTSKLLTLALADGHAVAALAWAAATAGCAGLGFLLDMTAMQRSPATRVAPPMFVLETVVPVCLAPMLFGEHWNRASGGVLLVPLALLLVVLGGGILGRAPAARALAAPPAAADAGRARPAGGS